MEIKALLIARNPKIISEISSDFHKNLINLEVVSNLDEFKIAIRKELNVVILNYADFDITGYENPESFCKFLKNANKDILIFVLAEAITDDKIISLTKSGADEISLIPKNFNLITQQIINLFNLNLKRKKNTKTRQKLALNDGAIQLNIPARKCFIYDKKSNKTIEIKLTRIEFSILALLISKKGKLVNYEEFKTKLWKNKILPKGIKPTLLQHITDLKKKLGEHSSRIENVWGEGYRIE